ncbi:hypothetical protein CGGC5_v016850 [Colletotrichum fructicola Nara gc5]|uniref:Tc1-like transposase DDE domain-containing protein n=1 Tax=Colletotrichum fructicola (strain Nara gc5) TaxID=1213859 RepID=A0A7J6ICV2_COLFN|nr:hypothetical protein CGGC5_v016850 [Colletotrichum fructicola Nara gc5]
MHKQGVGVNGLDEEDDSPSSQAAQRRLARLLPPHPLTSDRTVSCWSPKGLAPVQKSWYGRERRRHILPAYAQDGVMLSRVYPGSTDRVLFEDFIAQSLCHFDKWPEPKSVLVMDNASIHHSERLEQMCVEAGVKLVYLPPYSPDFNPIEEFLAELKVFIKRVWVEYEDLPEQDFGAFLEWCVDMVGGRKSSAEGHFRNAGHVIEEP